ncbi:phosphatase PAP2 family protein [Poriferisphaera sp. WC338]|uniref:phosphatase PAP2 family protein n=1 Tax=Poriferisphaera sp. WC338 TaxID=3425129 RepID=UPI003D81B25A
MQRSDLANMFRIAGFLPLWILIAFAILLNDIKYFRKFGFLTAIGRAVLLILTTATAGALAELIKVLVRRVRPSLELGSYEFRPFTNTEQYNWYESGNLGFPSSHTIVAFAAAFILCRFFPRAWFIWIIFAIGCAATRVLSQGHFLSDTVAAALFAFAITRFYWFWHLYNQRKLIDELDGKLPFESSLS